MAESIVPEQPVGPRSRHLWWWVGSIAACFISFAVGWRLHNPPAPLPPWRLTRLTADAGLSDFPALSPGGKLLAYSSNRGFEGERDLYVKQVAGGQPIRLTFDGAGNTMPDFSPDGSKIVFRSNRDGGGFTRFRLLAAKYDYWRGGIQPQAFARRHASRRAEGESPWCLTRVQATFG